MKSEKVFGERPYLDCEHCYFKQINDLMTDSNKLRFVVNDDERKIIFDALCLYDSLYTFVNFDTKSIFKAKKSKLLGAFGDLPF